MKRVIAIGRAGAGKTTLLNALAGTGDPAHKTQMVEFREGIVDTPGEYSEMPRFYHFLISTAMKAAVVLVVQDGTAPRSVLPPGFCRVFHQPVLGVVTKVDRPDARPERAETHLRLAGVAGPYCRVSAVTGEGLEGLRQRLHELTGGGSGNDV